MKKGLQGFLLTVAFFLFTSVVHAKTASEVFEAVSSSVVVIRAYDAKGQNQSLGSGVILENGVVVTNCHVVQEATTMQVVYKEKKYPANLLYSDWDRDVCSLAVDGLKGQAVSKGSTSHLRVGAKVYAIGAPKGLELTLSDGLISSLRQVEGGQYLQITAPISPGSSGGGLFDDEGRLIGLPTFYLDEGQQLNFAVPVEWVNELSKRTALTPKTKKMTSVEWLNKAVEFEIKMDWRGLVDHALRWTKTQPEDLNAWFTLGIAYEQSGQIVEAINAYQQAIRVEPKDANAWTNLGAAYFKSNQTTKAFEASQQAIRFNPENAMVWNNIGYMYFKTGQTAKAIDAYQQAVHFNPEYATAWVNLGVAYGEFNQVDNEVDAYQQALRINPEDPLAWKNIGMIYLSSNQVAKAIEAYQQAVHYNPQYADAWYDLGVAYKSSGQSSQVIEVYKHLKTLDSTLADQFYSKVVLF